MTETLEIVIATVANAELVEALGRLIPQLGPTVPPPTADEVREIVDSPSTTILFARDQSVGGRIIGALILIIFRGGSGLRALIEDVVVDADARGRGVGETLSREALRLAASRGASTVDLTSRPARLAANGLYKKIGFQRRETNVYRYVFQETDRDR